MQILKLINNLILKCLVHEFESHGMKIPMWKQCFEHMFMCVCVCVCVCVHLLLWYINIILLHCVFVFQCHEEIIKRWAEGHAVFILCQPQAWPQEEKLSANYPGCIVIQAISQLVEFVILDAYFTHEWIHSVMKYNHKLYQKNCNAARPECALIHIYRCSDMQQNVVYLASNGMKKVGW